MISAVGNLSSFWPPQRAARPTLCVCSWLSCRQPFGGRLARAQTLLRPHGSLSSGSLVAGDTAWLERTSITDAAFGAVLFELLGTSRRQQVQFGSIGTAVEMTLGIIAEVALSKELCPLVKIRKGDIPTGCATR